MFDITTNENYILIENLDNDVITDRPSSQIVFAKKFSNSTDYSVYWNGKVIDSLCFILWSDFTLNGVVFANQQEFEDWIRANTGSIHISADLSVDLTPATD